MITLKRKTLPVQIKRWVAGFLLAISVCYVTAQVKPIDFGSCTIHGINTFNDATIHTQVVNPNGEVNINVKYLLPLEEMEKITKQIKELKSLQAEVTFQQLSLKERETYIKEKEDLLLKRQVEADRVRKVNENIQENIDLAKKQFQKELKKARLEFEEALGSIPGSLKDNDPLKNKIEELRTVGKSIIGSAENCMTEDFTIYSIKDSLTQKTIYGFSLQEIKNDPNYVFIDRFINGLARVKRNNKYGFYNSKGELVIPFKYDFAESFRENYTLVKNYGRWFLIDKNENKLIDFAEVEKIGNNDRKIKDVKYFGKNLFEVDYNGSTYLYSEEGMIIVGPVDRISPFKKAGYFRVTNDYERGIINENGKWIVPVRYEWISEFNSKGLAIVSKEERRIINWAIETIRLYGLINLSGQEVIPSKYSSISIMDTCGLFLLEDRQKNYGIANSYGKIILDVEYTYIKTFDSFGLSKFRKKQKFGVVDVNGSIVIPPEYYELGEFNQYGLAKFIKEFQSFEGIINTKGQIIVPASKFYSIGPYNEYGYAVSEIADKKIMPINLSKQASRAESPYGVINTKGEVLVENVWRSIAFFQNNGELFLVSNSSYEIRSEEGYNRKKGTKNEYDIEYWQGNIGLVDKAGVIMHKPQFSKVYKFDDNGYAKVEKGDYSCGLINKKGELVLDCKYANIIDSFDESNTAIVSKGSYYSSGKGVVNTNGLEFIPCIFESIQRTEGGYSVKKGEKTFELDIQGKCISNNIAEFQEILEVHYKKDK